jgi:chromosome segregation protein
MFVKALKLSGFKSFADPTLLEFDPGVNVIVGPNGSGKSNLADALSWVLGSQAPASLRGGSMEDVIFAGSERRAGLGVATVELTLDNADRVLPLDLNEVTIARITDRSGQSEYRINGAPCRLLDVAELLSDTGIGRNLHTVVGQGQLDAILTARPEDRRAFIEEAAQIGKYRRRKDRSLKKLDRVEDNLTRLNDVAAELKRATRPLKRQAGVAAAYSELLAERRTLRQRMAATEVADLHAALAELGSGAERHRVALLEDELESIRARLKSAAAERRGRDDEAALRAGIAHRTARVSDRLAALARLADERAERMAARLAAETHEGYRERIRLLTEDRARWTAQVAELASHEASLRAAAESAAAGLGHARVERASVERTLSDARAAEAAAAQALVRAEGRDAAGRATRASIETRLHAVTEKRAVARRTVTDIAAEIAACEQEVATIETQLDTVTEAAAAAEVELEAARAHAESLRDRLGSARAGLEAAEARSGALQEVELLLADVPGVAERIAPLVADARRRVEDARDRAGADARVHAAAEQEVDVRWRKVVGHDDELRRLDALMAGGAERLGGARRRRETKEVELAALDEEIARTQEALASAETTASEERAALPARRAVNEEARSERAAAETELSAARRAENAAAVVAADTETAFRRSEERLLAARLRVEEAESGIADAERALTGLESLRSGLSAGIDRAREIANAARVAADRGRNWTRAAEQAAEAARAEARVADGRLTSLGDRERDLAERLETAARDRNRTEIARAEKAARLEAIAERTMEEWGMTIEDLAPVEVLPEPELARAGERITELDRAMKRLGPVNPRAAEEYAELEERERFLTGQIDDLKRSRRDLLAVVHEIDDTIRTVFSAAFDAVQREFEEVFGRLFPGGRGRLVLTDPGDRLNSGVEVDARPPGKNVRKLSLLSGGERSLVALAFLFAIFRSRPSPFYLLDEVEAALDDVNLSRFLVLVRELEESAQVLIVTHQKRTMEAGDVLYGVTMGAAGVSRVVATRLDRPQAAAAPRV